MRLSAAQGPFPSLLHTSTSGSSRRYGTLPLLSQLSAILLFPLLFQEGYLLLVSVTMLLRYHLPPQYFNYFRFLHCLSHLYHYFFLHLSSLSSLLSLLSPLSPPSLPFSPSPLLPLLYSHASLRLESQLLTS